MSSRLIDPVEHVRRTTDEQLGVVPQRTMVIRSDQNQRFDGQSDRTQRIIVFETIEFYQYDMPANTSQSMMQLFISAGLSLDLTASPPDISTQCRICGLRILCNGVGVTAGTITPYISVTEGADTTIYTFSECELNTTDNRRKSVIFQWEQSIQIAEDSTFFLGLTSSAGFTPTTADFKAHVTLGYDQWVAS